MSNMSGFTAGAQEAVNKAAQFASGMGENYVGTEHLLLGLVMEGGTAAEILERQGINEANAR
ncbi:MAG: Clp protease N-terminal domain-containing protein, partial [Christensenella sp.]|uniref:Clp protease N-terminal domain-containing protein n=1 Tax=Christensenella sp. TaxID=1935934 RepID=UPI002B1F5D9D